MNKKIKYQEPQARIFTLPSPLSFMTSYSGTGGAEDWGGSGDPIEGELEEDENI